MMRGSCFILTDFIQKLVSEVEDGPNAAEGEQREVNNLYPLLMQHNGGRDSWNKGKNNTNIVLNQCLVHMMIFHLPSFFLRG